MSDHARLYVKIRGDECLRVRDELEGFVFSQIRQEFTKEKRMTLEKSPSGAYFPYYYKGGELFGLHLGSFHNDEAGVIQMIKAEEAFFIKQNRMIGEWIDLYETGLTDKVITELVEMLKHEVKRIKKLALVGCSFKAKWKINRLIKKTQDLSALPVKYFDDPEEAKTWLVSEEE